jgi:NTP pyrophosphatase (non-canonical NTP hydrolase)
MDIDKTIAELKSVDKLNMKDNLYIQFINEESPKHPSYEAETRADYHEHVAINYDLFASWLIKHFNTRKPDEAKAMIAEMLIAEVGKATKKFPIWPTDPLHAVAILNEEVGELNQAILQTIYEPEKSDKYDVRDEAIQAGAMVIRFIMSLDRYNYNCSLQHEQELCKSEGGEDGTATN